MKIRRAAQEDFLKVHRFTAECLPSETYPEHVYKIILRYFGDCCFICEENDSIVGSVMGIVPLNFPGTYFLWQIGVSPLHQGKGIGKKLLMKVEEELKRMKFTRIEATIDPVNLASQKLFLKMGYKNISEKVGKTIKVEGKAAVQDYYNPGRHFMVYEKQIHQNL
ncbi:MAG TPA: GNAT family N-acetyltransferase [Candidatus Methanoperedens sp.]